MDNKQAFQVWTPARAWAWTRYAKAALFANPQPYQPNAESRQLAGQLISGDLPFELQAYDYNNTIVIIDLPGVESVQYGLKLYRQSGLQPIPMFNVVVGTNTGAKADVVETAELTNALAAGTYVLETGSAQESHFASFLLDYDRDNPLSYGPDVYDNRWSVNENDLPDSQYLAEAGVTNVLYITQGTPHNDIAHILSEYQRGGQKVQIYSNGEFHDWTWDSLDLGQLVSTPPLLAANNGTEIPNANLSAATLAPSATPVTAAASPNAATPTKAMLAERAHPAQKALTWLFGILAAISVLNAFVQWNFLRPALWTIPAAQWLIYDILPEATGDFFLVAFTAFNIFVWFAVWQGSTKAIKVGVIAFIIDAIWFFLYDFNYGFMEFAVTPAYALFAFGLPLLFGAAILVNFLRYRKFLNSPTPPGWYNGQLEEGEQQYWNGSSWDDRIRYQSEPGSYAFYTRATRPVMFVRSHRVHGYSGYGGTGRGGYSGSHGGGYSSMGG